MPNSNNPFELDDGFEGIPVVQNPVQGVKQAATTAVKATAAQAKAAAKTFVSQLYGASDPTTATVDDQTDAVPNAAPQMQPHQQAISHMPPQPSQKSALPTKNPAKQAKIEETRRKLAQTHTSNYYLNMAGDVTNLESDVRKREEERKQADEQRKQQIEEEEKKLEELKEQQKKEPISVTRARNKAESNRGASG